MGAVHGVVSHRQFGGDLTTMPAARLQQYASPRDSDPVARGKVTRLAGKIKANGYKPQPDPETGEGGRGLLLVEAVASGWGTSDVADGKIVWATLRIHRHG